MAKIPGLPIAFIGVGGVLVYSGVENQPLGTLLRTLAQGKKPVPGPAETYATAASTTPAASTGAAAPGDTGASSASAAANQAIARVLAAPYGWSAGQQWEDLVSLWNRESGWSNTIENQGSGAYGIAQALGHGPTNQYPAGAANPPPAGTSSATAQISWGLSYIKNTYGSPSAAWAHEESEGWY
jgi:resuscitation-promoting factor RpfB